MKCQYCLVIVPLNMVAEGRDCLRREKRRRGVGLVEVFTASIVKMNKVEWEERKTNIPFDEDISKV